MPPVSERQRKLMQAALSSPEVRRQRGISKKVAAEFVRSDPGGKLPAKVAKKPRK
jgi:cytochrome P450